jgi:hypothetical protein
MSGPRRVLHGLTAPLKERLIQDALQRRLRKVELDRDAPPALGPRDSAALRRDSIPEPHVPAPAHDLAGRRRPPGLPPGPAVTTSNTLPARR